jgi:hypothetical protein
MLLLIPTLVVLLALVYAWTRRLAPGVKLLVRALLMAPIFGFGAYIASGLQDPAPPGSIEVSADDLNRAASAAVK